MAGEYKAKISDLSDELLVKILSFLPTKIAVSTSVLSKQWEFLWMWLPNLDFDCGKGSVRDFFNKNLPLHKSPIIKSLRLRFLDESLEAEASNSWVGIAVSRGLRELSVQYLWISVEEAAVFSFLPSSLYTCNSLVTFELENPMILVDVPRTVCLPSLKTLKLRMVTYSNDDSVRLLLSNCPVLEDLTIERHWEDNVEVFVIRLSSLRSLSLDIRHVEYEEYVIVTPSLKYFKVVDHSEGVNYSIEHMPELEEADITFWKHNVKLLESITTVKRLSLCMKNNYKDEVYYGGGLNFIQLENLKLCIDRHDWSNILLLLLKGSPNLQTLDLQVDNYSELSDDDDEEDSLVSWSSSVPECLLKSLKTFKFKGSKFKGSTDEKEERAVLSFIINISSGEMLEIQKSEMLGSVLYRNAIRILQICRKRLSHLIVDDVVNIANKNVLKTPSFAKTLTQSDANNGGGFSVPRYCAETIFPRLDYNAEPPVQTMFPWVYRKPGIMFTLTT